MFFFLFNLENMDGATLILQVYKQLNINSFKPR